MNQLHRCLEEMDVDGARLFWHEMMPSMPQPRTEFEAVVCMHMARTQLPSLDHRRRYYSHRWLTERNYPSQLPDEEKPMAERMYPELVSSVGIAVAVREDWLKPVIPLVRTAMENAVLEAYADGRSTDVDFIRRRMNEARITTQRQLLGKLTHG